jgi:hypothetical protein
VRDSLGARAEQTIGMYWCEMRWFTREYRAERASVVASMVQTRPLFPDESWELTYRTCRTYCNIRESTWASGIRTWPISDLTAVAYVLSFVPAVHIATALRFKGNTSVISREVLTGRAAGLVDRYT